MSGSVGSPKQQPIAFDGNLDTVPVNTLLQLTAQHGASDLHLTADMPPLLRLKGELVPIGTQTLTGEHTRRLANELLPARQQKILEENLSVDLSFSRPDSGRFRLNAYMQRGAVTVALRLLSDDALSFSELGLPESVSKLAELRDGLVLVTGPTGSGKSTTLAALIDSINRNFRRNIITIEDPIEYVHHSIQSVINQRELYTDVPSFVDALRSALRADPDVILVGEMRDLDTIRTAIMAAETGHLVFSTLHSRDTVSAINRMVGVFPPGEQEHIRQQLSSALKAVISQRLVPRADDSGRALITEVMIVTGALGNLIRLSKHEQMYSSIEMGAREGSHSFEQCLMQLYKDKVITKEVAVATSKNATSMEERLKRV